MTVKRWRLVATIMVLLFAAFVWPTLYRYDRLVGPGGQEVPVRINRITGQAEKLGWSGWHALKPRPAKPKEPDLDPQNLGITEGTVEDLGRAVRRKWPAYNNPEYDAISDADLGRLVREKFYPSYEHIKDVP